MKYLEKQLLSSRGESHSMESKLGESDHVFIIKDKLFLQKYDCAGPIE